MQHDDWCTPPEIVSALGPFDLDPCASDPQPFRTAGEMWTEGGLESPWIDRVWLNPPYGRETGLWLRKLAAHGCGIALVFARTETEMFHEHVWPKASAMLFLRGRLHFYTPGGVRAKANSGAPSVLISYDDPPVDQRNLRALKDVAANGLIAGRFVNLARDEARASAEYTE
jgi:hypothetical protein